AQPFGEVRDWKRGECEPIPGKTMPKLVPVERDYAAIYRKWRSLGPLAEQLGSAAKGIALHPTVELDELRAANGEEARRHCRGARGRPDHVRRYAGAAAQGDRLPRVVGHGVPRPALLAVH